MWSAHCGGYFDIVAEGRLIRRRKGACWGDRCGEYMGICCAVQVWRALSDPSYYSRHFVAIRQNLPRPTHSTAAAAAALDRLQRVRHCWSDHSGDGRKCNLIILSLPGGLYSRDEAIKRRNALHRVRTIVNMRTTYIRFVVDRFSSRIKIPFLDLSPHGCTRPMNKGTDVFCTPSSPENDWHLHS